ncbi:hypothetical protein OE88DRAFT_1736798 [Heliocybe sulcata]|uniref:F-box domain-containing protein n=1 Tax=Heliocybe sulcata TaxID=5364 RepID=A0A5C3MY60_9AGAM|nr:hypothetical protein OE88DRAFT_1736798 [Heliocybe sulcata]
MTKLRDLSLTVRGLCPQEVDEAAMLSHFDSPELRTLELRDFPWAAVRPALRDGLEELTLASDPWEVIHTEELLAALAGMPHLRKLHIDGWYQTVVVKDVHPVILPRLESLTSSRALGMEDLTSLTFISTPVLRHLHLEFAWLDASEMNAALSKIEHLLRAAAMNCRPCTARFCLCNAKELHITFRNDPTRRRLSSEGIHVRLPLGEAYQSLSIIAEMMGAAFQSFKSLEVVDGADISFSGYWQKICTKFSHIRNLHLEGSTIKLLPYGLDSKKETYCPVFKNLEVLSLRNVLFGKTNFLHELERSLERHREANRTNNPTLESGVQLHVIITKGQQLLLKDVQALRELGAKVMWDDEECGVE